ncbi:MAG: hypothetical protein F2667_07650 [Actinobacteria bacterium]|uniref:Unannotated protein n=1 Tax=freshwater metagenome TaxID=449393 RepID=A0A6J6QJ97_9ZZZZ|nr:hypothetical protein [Actinomycetota bacterium]
MPDPLFDHFQPEGTPVTPLPASEVRRRGDRMRRRNTTLAAVGSAAAAVLLIAVPMAVVSRDGDSGAVIDPAGTPSAVDPTGPVSTAWVQQIPRDFPLTSGMPDGTSAPGPFEPQIVGPCGNDGWTPAGSVDEASVIWTDQVEASLQRALALYPDAEAAAAAIDEVRSQVAECVTPRGNRDAIEAVAVTSDLGEDSFAFVNRWYSGGDLTGEGHFQQLVRVGNAVLFANGNFGSAGDQAVIDQTADLFRTRTAYTVSAMCVFAADPCDEVPPAAPESSIDGVDLLIGYPDDAGTTSDADGAGASSTLDLCGRTAFDPGNAIHVREANYQGEAEDTRGRTLAEFGSVAEAEAMMEQAAALLADCPEERSASGAAVFTPVDLALGQQALSWTTRYSSDELDGGFDTGLTVHQLVRVGSVVLVAMEYGEGGGSDETIASFIEQMTADTAAVVDQLS